MSGGPAEGAPDDKCDRMRAYDCVDEMVQTARKERVDLIALGIGDEHDQQVVQHSNCAVLTVNRFAS